MSTWHIALKEIINKLINHSVFFFGGGEVEKSSFNWFARQRGPQWANALKTM